MQFDLSNFEFKKKTKKIFVKKKLVGYFRDALVLPKGPLNLFNEP